MDKFQTVLYNAQIVESRTTGRHPLPGEGAIPVSALHFRTGATLLPANPKISVLKKDK